MLEWAPNAARVLPLHCTLPIQGGPGTNGAKLLLMRHLGFVTCSPPFSRQTSRGKPLRLPREALVGLGCVIQWDGVCISRMGGLGGPPLQIKSVQRRSSERSGEKRAGLGQNGREIRVGRAFKGAAACPGPTKLCEVFYRRRIDPAEGYIIRLKILSLCSLLTKADRRAIGLPSSSTGSSSSSVGRLFW